MDEVRFVISVKPGGDPTGIRMFLGDAIYQYFKNGGGHIVDEGLPFGPNAVRFSAENLGIESIKLDGTEIIPNRDKKLAM